MICIRSLIEHPTARNLQWAVVLTWLVFSTTEAKGDQMCEGGLLAYGVVKEFLKDDRELCHAIDRSRQSLSQLRRVVASAGARQADFIVVALEKANGKLIPRGIVVDRIAGETFHGRATHNSLLPSPTSAASCREYQIIDWHYTDTFEHEGGTVYRLLYRRQPRPVRRKIAEESGILMKWREDISVEIVDPVFRDLLRDIANLRYIEVERKLRANVSLKNRVAVFPQPDRSSFSPNVRLRPMTVSQQAAKYGDARMIRLLHKLGPLEEISDGNPLLVSSAASGNTNTTRAMLELGFDVEITSDIDCTPLGRATAWDREDVVAVLLEHGANPNRIENGRRPTLFNVKSAAVAKRLLAAGASVDLTDDEGRTCVEHMMEHGHVAVVDLLVRHGAAKDPNARYGLNEEQTMAKGREVIRKHLKSTDPTRLAEYELSSSTDFGCVLPVRSIQIK